jgi:hypothetical protein
MTLTRILARSLATLGLATAALLTHAAPLPTAWTDWKKDNVTNLTGTLMLASGAVKVKYTGPNSFFHQLGEADDRDYWTISDPNPYDVTGRPKGTDILGFMGGTGSTRYKITFSRPVTNPVFAILSLGAPGVPAHYVFRQTPTLLSSGHGFYGGCADCLQVEKKTVTGSEGHGVIQFIGTFESISWTDAEWENWHGIQVGAPVDQ